jgi:hypothetical protein
VEMEALLGSTERLVLEEKAGKGDRTSHGNSISIYSLKRYS